MEIKDQLAEIKRLNNEAVEAVKNDANANIDRLKNEINGKIELATKSNDDLKKQVEEATATVEKMRKEGARNPEILTLQKSIEKGFTDKTKEIEHFKSTRQGFGFETKAAAIMTMAGATNGAVVDNAYLPGIVGDVRRQTRLRQFFSVQPTSGNAIPYIAQTATNNGAAFIGDGVLKPLSDKEITLVEAPVRKVGHHMRLSEELLNDIPALSGFLTTQGIEDLLDIEDNMIFAGANNTTPNFKGFSIDAIKTAAIPAAFPKKAAPNRFDALLAAMAALASRNYVADRILLNPTDLFGMLSQNTGTNDQQNAITFVGGALRIAGYSIETTTAIPAGTFAVANFSRGAGLFQREGISVRLFDQDQDNAVKNLVTVVIEERLAMPIYYPDMFFVDTFANVLTGITV